MLTESYEAVLARPGMAQAINNYGNSVYFISFKDWNIIK